MVRSHLCKVYNLIRRHALFRWRPLEAILLVLGSLSEDILSFSEEEQEAGRPKPIDIELLLADAIPRLLSQNGV